MRESSLAARLVASMCILVGAPLVAAGVAGAAGPARSAPSAPAHPRVRPHVLKIYATYYGWYTNTPPGCATAYPTFRTGCAGGTGTYDDPITLASDPAEFPVGTVFYYPNLKKYFVMGDYCTTCVLGWTTVGPNGGPRFRQVDLWIGGQGGTEFAEIDCEDALTQGTVTGAAVQTLFVVDPPPGLPVSRQQLFDIDTNRCFGGASIAPTHGEYENGMYADCLEDPRASGVAGTPAQVATCTRAVTGEDLEFEGDFLVVNGLCLAIDTPSPTTGTTSGLEWTTCAGTSREQWEVGSTGPIEWIQYVGCVVQTGSGGTTLRMSACTFTTPPPADQTWTFVAHR
jgi:hypothetical protein